MSAHCTGVPVVPLTVGNKVENMLDSDAGKAGLKLYLIAFGLVVSVLLTLSTVLLGQINDRASTGVTDNIRQDQTFIKQQAQMDYTGHRVDALERSSDATIQTLQALTSQITRMSDKLNDEEIAKGRGHN